MRLNRRRAIKSIGAGLASVGLSGCLGGDGTPDESDGNGGGEGNGDGTQTEPDSTPEDAPDFDALVQRAREEGELKLGTSSNAQTALREQFDADYPDIELNVQLASASEIATLVIQEASAGRMTFDVLGNSTGDLMATYLDEDLLRPIHPVVKGAFPNRVWNDYLVTRGAAPALGFQYHPDNISSVPSTIDDLFGMDELKDGNFGIDQRDQQILMALTDFHGEDRAKEILGRVASELEPSFYSSHFGLSRDIQQGEINAGFGYHFFEPLEDFPDIENGQLEDWPITTTVFWVGVTADAPHPNAGSLFQYYDLENTLDIMEEIGQGHIWMEPPQPDSVDEWEQEHGMWVLTPEESRDVDLEQIDSEWREVMGIKG